jgi:nickel transport protein
MRSAVFRLLLVAPALPAAGEAMRSESVWAHGIHLQVRVEGDVIRGTAGYVSGGPVETARVRVLAPSGRELGSTRTDAEGRFEFTPHEAVDHRFLLEGGPGHVAEASLAADLLPAGMLPSEEETANNASPGELQATVEQAVSRQVGPLSEEIDRLRRSLRLHDVLGGIGYIAGLAGLWFYLAARRRRPQREGATEESRADP